MSGASEPDRAGQARVLQVDPAACPEVIDAAFAVLRERCLRDESEGAPRRLAELNAAHRALRAGAPQAASGAGAAPPSHAARSSAAISSTP